MAFLVRGRAHSIASSGERRLSRGRRLWVCGAWLILLPLALIAGCKPSTPSAPDVQVDLTMTPSPPAIGEVGVLLKLTNAGGSPLAGASVALEGNMNHAGMKPSFADLREVEPGKYAGTLDFTMGGDWFILVTAKTSDGKMIERKIDVPGVKAK